MYNAYISDKNGMSERRKKVKKKALYKKWMSMLLAGVVTTTGFMGGTVTWTTCCRGRSGSVWRVRRLHR